MEEIITILCTLFEIGMLVLVFLIITYHLSHSRRQMEISLKYTGKISGRKHETLEDSIYHVFFWDLG